MTRDLPHASDEVKALLRRDVTAEEYTEIRDVWKRHSIAEDNRDLDGLISTLTPDCVYEIVGTGERWEGHDGARRFYTEFLSAFPDVHFALTNIVIGPQGVCEEANVAGTHEKRFGGGPPPTGERIDWQVVIFFPWDRERRLFTGERIWSRWPDK